MIGYKVPPHHCTKSMMIIEMEKDSFAAFAAQSIDDEDGRESGASATHKTGGNNNVAGRRQQHHHHQEKHSRQPVEEDNGIDGRRSVTAS